MATQYSKIQLGVPPGGSDGQVLTRTADGWAWKTPTSAGGTALPAGADGQVLTWAAGSSSWVPADPPATQVTAESITDATEVGRSVLTAANAAAARSAIKAGTVSTVNGFAPDSTGNVTIATGGGSSSGAPITYLAGYGPTF